MFLSLLIKCKSLLYGVVSLDSHDSLMRKVLIEPSLYQGGD